DVDEPPDLIDLRFPLEIVDHVDEVRLESALERRAEELLLALEVPEDQRLRDLRLLRDLGERGVGVALAREETGRGLEDLLPRVHAASLAAAGFPRQLRRFTPIPPGPAAACAWSF